MKKKFTNETATEAAVSFYARKNPAIYALIEKLELRNVDEETGLVIDKDFFNEFNFTKKELSKMKITVSKDVAAAAPEVTAAPKNTPHDLEKSPAQGIFKGFTNWYVDKTDSTKTFRFPLIENEGELYSLPAWKDLAFKLKEVPEGHEIYVCFVSREKQGAKTIIKVKVIDLTAQADGLFNEEEEKQGAPKTERRK